jgi:hypothetical protein
MMKSNPQSPKNADNKSSKDSKSQLEQERIRAAAKKNTASASKDNQKSDTKSGCC